MNDNSHLSPKFAELVQRVLNGEATSEDGVYLNKAMEQNEAARDHYMEMIVLHSAIRKECGTLAAELVSTPDSVIDFPVAESGSSAAKKPRYLLKHAAIAAAVAMVAGISFLLFPTGTGSKSPVYKVVSIRGLGDSNLPDTGEWISSGDALRLSDVSVEFSSGDGNRFIFHGPGELEVTSRDEFVLKSGSLWAELEGDPIRIRVPNGEITDLGTTFGVHCESGQSSRVDVFDGTVKYTHAENSANVAEVNVGESLEFAGVDWQPHKGEADKSYYLASNKDSLGFTFLFNENEVDLLKQHRVYDASWTGVADKTGIAQLGESPIEVRWAGAHLWQDKESDDAEQLVMYSYICGKDWPKDIREKAEAIGLDESLGGIVVQFDHLDEWLHQIGASAYNITVLMSDETHPKKQFPSVSLHRSASADSEAFLVWSPEKEELRKSFLNPSSKASRSIVKDFDQSFTESTLVIALDSKTSTTSASTLSGVILTPVR